MLVQTYVRLKQLLTALVTWAGAAPFTPLHVRLFQNNFTPSPNMVVGDLVECTFTGYAASTVIVWNPVGDDDTGNALVIGDQKLFAATGSAIGNMAFGYYVTDAAGTVVYWAERFATPKSFDSAGDQLAVVPTFDLANQE